MSEPSARKTMREFEAVGIVKTSRTSGSINSELKIKLNNEFQWFLTDEFRKLCNPSTSLYHDFSRESIYCNNNIKYQSLIIKNLCATTYYNSKSCDNNNNYCHTLKQNLPRRGL